MIDHVLDAIRLFSIGVLGFSMILST
jgi:hypothetical protein